MNTPPSQLGDNIDYYTIRQIKNQRLGINTNSVQKTTAMSRWYSYAEFFSLNEAALSSSTTYSLPYMWKNDSVFMRVSGSVIDTNNLISSAIVVDPKYCFGFNNSSFYWGLMLVKATDTFTVDSIAFSGKYEVNPSQTTIDTIRLSFVYGNGTAPSDIYTNIASITAGSLLYNYGPVGGSLNSQRIHFDAAHLTAGGSTLYTYDILIDNATSPPSWVNDTATGGLYFKKIPVGVTVPAGNMIGATVSFLSGAVVPAWDTVYLGSTSVPSVKYNMFRPGILYRGSSTLIAFPTYNVSDKNNGAFVDKLTKNIYTPQWFFSSGTNASKLQYPDISFLLSCSSCQNSYYCSVDVDEISTELYANASPNPSYNELNIPFISPGTANVTVTLSNVLGQVVGTQNMGKVTTGKATFNTLSLPAGVYVYNVIADGKRNTGRVVIAH